LRKMLELRWGRLFIVASLCNKNWKSKKWLP
jgi:hypothetical protein